MDAKHILMTGLISVSLAGCASNPSNINDPDYKLSRQCEKKLDMAYEELNFSKASGFGGSWEYTKAASLLSAASVQSNFGGYEGCVEKVNSAQAYIKQSQQQ